jgi:hypothetical protein
MVSSDVTTYTLAPNFLKQVGLLRRFLKQALPQNNCEKQISSTTRIRPSVYLCARMEKPGSQLVNFRTILYLKFPLTSWLNSNLFKTRHWAHLEKKLFATNRKVTGSIPDGVIGIFH